MSKHWHWFIGGMAVMGFIMALISLFRPEIRAFVGLTPQ